jgi:hypothetical protein
LRAQAHDYRLIDTKVTLAAGLAAGEANIFYVDDTHWGPRTSQRIADALYRPLIPQTPG